MQKRHEKSRSNALSRRELEVLRLGAQGATDGEISERLSISVPTLRTYWLRIRDKVGGINRTHAIALAVAGPLVPDDDPTQRLIQRAKSEGVVEWTWRPARRQATLDAAALGFFGLSPEESPLALDRLLGAVWEPDQPRFERYLLQCADVGPLTPIDVRLGTGDFRQTVRTVNLLTHRVNGSVVVLLATVPGREA